MCGADLIHDETIIGRRGSPPRVRSRQQESERRLRCDGITSACAEQTSAPPTRRPRPRDHLRVCGADSLYSSASSEFVGSPPRVRSRRDDLGHLVRDDRITSACAEQTGMTVTVCSAAQDHLRVCGADDIFPRLFSIRLGSPPRVRSRRGWRSRGRCRIRITSACAEQTKASRDTR